MLADKTYEFDFSSVDKVYTDAECTTQAKNNTSVSTFYYKGEDNVVYTFVADGKNRSFNSGYFILGKSGATLTLPTFSGEKIKNITLHSSGSHSTNVSVNIYSGTNPTSTSLTWKTLKTDYSYDISDSYQSDQLKVKVTNSNNAQFTKLIITTVGSSTSESKFEFDSETATAYLGLDFTEPTLTNTYGDEYSVSYSSETTSVATVDETSGEVTLKGEGDTKITAALKSGEETIATASYTLTVKPEKTFQLFVAKTSDGKYYALSSETGSANNSLAAVEVTVYDGKVVFETVNTNLLWSIDKENGYIQSYSGEYLTWANTGTDVTTSTTPSVWVYQSDGYWGYNDKSNSKTLRCILYNTSGYFKNYASSNIGEKNYSSTAALVMDYVLGVQITIGDTGYTTLYYSDRNLALPEGVTGYVVKYSDSDNKLTYTDVYYKDGTTLNPVPKDQAVILKGTANTTYTLTAVDDDEVMFPKGYQGTENDLIGHDDAQEATTTDGTYIYYFGYDKTNDVVGFYEAPNKTSYSERAHKAYLHLPYDVSTSGAKMITLEYSSTTAIKGVDSQVAPADNAVYTISGMKVNADNLKPGLYIKQGRKFIVK